MLDMASYAMGQSGAYTKGYDKGYDKGYADGEVNVELDGTMTFTDDGSGNITITEGN